MKFFILTLLVLSFSSNAVEKENIDIKKTSKIKEQIEKADKTHQVKQTDSGKQKSQVQPMDLTGKKDLAERSDSSERTNPKTQTSKKEQELQDKCGDSGQDLVHSYKFTSSFLKFSSKVFGWLDNSFPYLKKEPKKQCPKDCIQVNNFQVVSRVSPETVKKGSCRGDQAKETYSFRKKFPYKKTEMLQSHSDMMDWILGTFVYPYFPLPVLEPTQEAIDNNLSKACPSCSFYVNYDYKYVEGDTLDLSITAKCGDIRKTMSRVKVQFALFNHWSCKEPDKKNLAGK